jgi:hypothetical protein
MADKSIQDVVCKKAVEIMMKHSNCVVTQLINRNKNNEPFDDNLCFFRALALFKLRQDKPWSQRVSEKNVKMLYDKYCRERGKVKYGSLSITSFPVEMGKTFLEELPYLQNIFQTDIHVYSKDWINNGVPNYLYGDEKSKKYNLMLDLTSNHLSLIVNKCAYLKHYSCTKCKRRFDDSRALWNHLRMKNCNLRDFGNWGLSPWHEQKKGGNVRAEKRVKDRLISNDKKMVKKKRNF